MRAKRLDAAPASANLFQELLELVEDLAGIRTVIYDKVQFTASAGRARLDRVFQGHRCAFCKAIRVTDRGERACVASDVREATEEAIRRRAPFVHTCHAGLCELVMPIVYRGQNVATVFCGQAAVKGCPADDVKWLARRARALGVDSKAVVAAYRSLPRTTEERLIKVGTMLFRALGHLAESEGRAGLDRSLALDRHRSIRRAIEYVEEHYREPIGVSDAAAYCDLVPSYLSRAFHRVIGTTFSEFLTNRRIEHAKELLLTTSMDMTSIAVDSGYSHQSYFGRKFRAIVGLTPRQYRSRERPGRSK